MNLALAGTACSQLLSIFKFAFGYPESKEARERGKQLEELEHKFESDNESPTEEDTVSKSQDTLDAAAQFADADEPKPKQRRFEKCCDNLMDLVPLHKATPIMPSTTVKLSKTGVSCKIYSKCEESEGQSIYHCKLLKPNSSDECTHYAAQLVVMCTHIHCKHLQLCIKCRLCKKKSFSSTTMSVHLKTVHHNSANEWFKPTPSLKGDVTKVTDEILTANLQEIKEVKEEQEETE